MSLSESERRRLGMDRAITRRDFVQGAVVGGAALALGCASGAKLPPPGPVGASSGTPLNPALYPPARLGMRGSHKGSFETAHQLALGKRRDWGAASEPDSQVYDLVVVGGGVSGLAAAHFYLQEVPDARILLIENHDDFGGHAKRNEFQLDGRTLLGHGGSQSLDGPGDYSRIAKGLLKDIGVEPQRLSDSYDLGFYQRNGLASGIYFDVKTYGVDKLLRCEYSEMSRFMRLARTGTALLDQVWEMPISQAAQQELIRLLKLSKDQLPEYSIFSEPRFLRSISYLDLLTKHMGVSEPEVLALFHDVPSGYLGVGIDCAPALDCLFMGLPGLSGTSLGFVSGLINRALRWLIEPYTYHFPDGNASVARLLVRQLIPEVAEGSTMHDVVLAPFDYTKLDQASSRVRLRLSSTVVRVQHEGDVSSAKQAAVTYVRGGRTERVKAKHVVLACYNAIIPYLCTELPEAQKTALHSLVKSPLIYTNVLLSHWRAFHRAGVGVFHNPGSWHQFAMLDFPVSFPGYRYSSDPSQPIVLHMSRVPTTPGLTPREQSRAGQAQLLQTSFEQIEGEIRGHLGGMLGAGDFDPARDIEAIVVNRWPHGYSWEPNRLFDPETEEGEAPHEIGRQRFGRIAIANSDAGASAYLDVAIDQAHRAVEELTS